MVVFKDGGYFTYDGELFPLLVFQFVDGGKNTKNHQAGSGVAFVYRLSRSPSSWRAFFYRRASVLPPRPQQPSHLPHHT